MEGTFFTQNAHPNLMTMGEHIPKHNLAKVRREETCHLNVHANLKDMGMNTHSTSPSVFCCMKVLREGRFRV
jgi:hypothetical protein